MGHIPNSVGGRTPVVCVFCGSSPGRNPAHLESARSLGKALHASGYQLVYGGGTLGIMGELARTLVASSGPGSVRGIIPRALIRGEKKGVFDNGGDLSGLCKAAERIVSEQDVALIDGNEDQDTKLVPESEFGTTIIVPDMHTRKSLMGQQVQAGGPGSGFVALAGGYGTMEEVMEMVTWNQLGIHQNPIVLVNIDGYWDGLLTWVKNSVKEGFVSKGNASILVEVRSTDDVVEALQNYKVADGRFKVDWNR